jgi:hypothetical protein
MSLRALPTILIAFFLYNIIVGIWGPEVLTRAVHADIPLPSGARWSLTVGDLIMVTMLFLLFIELLKSATTATSGLIDHALSLIVFIVCLLEFILWPRAATSTFFFITIATLIDTIAGYTIGTRIAARSIGFGGPPN